MKFLLSYERLKMYFQTSAQEICAILEHFKNKTLTVWLLPNIRKKGLREQPYNILMQANMIRTGYDTILSSETRKTLTERSII